MDLEKFKELRVVVKNTLNPKHHGQTYIVLFAELNELGEPILFLETSNGLLSIDLKQVDYVKVFDHWSVQYYDKVNKTNLDIPFENADLSDNNNLVKIGVWDYFSKEFNILSLVE